MTNLVLTTLLWAMDILILLSRLWLVKTMALQEITLPSGVPITPLRDIGLPSREDMITPLRDISLPSRGL